MISQMTPATAAAYDRLLTHGATCRPCRTLTATGANAELPCATRDRLYQAYRQALRNPSTREQR